MEIPDERGCGTDPIQSDDGYLFLIPVFNDWAALRKLLAILDGVLVEHGLEARVLVVDDGSMIAAEERFFAQGYEAITRVDALQLRRNLGHQRALAIGLAYVEDKVPCQAVIVMDSDGEDDPGDVPRLLQKYQEESGQKIIFAERARRSESLSFRVFYVLYKIVHYLLTSRAVRVGNFSVIPSRRLASLVVVSEMWNHYAAAVFESRQPLDMIPTRRGRRLDGKSTMNFIKLVTHGLSAISVYGETVGVRLLVATSVLIALSLAGLGCVVAVRVMTDLAVPGWTTYTAGLLLLMLFQAFNFSFVCCFMILSSRKGSTFLPIRDYPYFVGGIKPLCQQGRDGKRQSFVADVKDTTI